MTQNYHFEIHLIPIHAITLAMLSSVEFTLKSLAFTAGLHNIRYVYFPLCQL